MQRCHLKGISIVSIPLTIYPPGFLIYAGVQGEEDGQEEGKETN